MKLFNRYKFSDKSQTLGGVISTLMGIASLCCLVYGVYMSFTKGGAASVIGTVMGLLSFKEDNKFYTLSKIGSLLCGILTIFMISVLIMGLGF